MIRPTVIDASRGPLCGTLALADLVGARTPAQEDQALDRCMTALLGMAAGHAGEAANSPFTRPVWLARLDRVWLALDAVRGEMARRRTV